MANQCAMIIRSRDHLPAYVINYGEQERKKRTAEIEQELKLNPDARMPRRTTRIPDQCAVVVGGFATIDAARTALDKVKQLAAPEIKLSEGKVNSWLKEIVLLDQPFVKDESKTVGELLKGAGLKAKRFVVLRVGQI